MHEGARLPGACLSEDLAGCDVRILGDGTPLRGGGGGMLTQHIGVIELAPPPMVLSFKYRVQGHVTFYNIGSAWSPVSPSPDA